MTGRQATLYLDKTAIPVQDFTITAEAPAWEMPVVESWAEVQATRPTSTASWTLAPEANTLEVPFAATPRKIVVWRKKNTRYTRIRGDVRVEGMGEIKSFVWTLSEHLRRPRREARRARKRRRK